MHLLEDGVLCQEVPALLLRHSLGNRTDGGEVHDNLLPLLHDPATHHQLLGPWDLESGHLGYQTDEPGHQAHLSRIGHLV